MQNLQRVRRYQRELEDAEGRADQAESRLKILTSSVQFVSKPKPFQPAPDPCQAPQLGGHQQEQLAKGLRARGRAVNGRGRSTLEIMGIEDDD